MPNIGNLTRPKPTRAVVDLGDGDTVTVLFDRNRITPAWVRAAGKRDEEQDPMSVPQALAEVILEWDVTANDGSPFPPTRDNIAVLSFPSQKDLLTRIMEAAVPGEAEGKASPATSAAPSPDFTATETPSPNGQGISPSPVPSVSPSPT